jgi:hypothetical protein
MTDDTAPARRPTAAATLGRGLDDGADDIADRARRVSRA